MNIRSFVLGFALVAAVPLPAHALLPSFDYSNFGVQLIKNIEKATSENEKRTQLIQKLKLDALLGKQEIEAANNQAANTIIRINQQKTDVHNMEVASQAMPVAGSCKIVTNSVSASLAKEGAQQRALAREDELSKKVRENLEALSGSPLSPEARPNQVQDAIGERIKNAHAQNKVLAGQDIDSVNDPDPLLEVGMQGTVAQPWETHRFFNQERLEGQDLAAARDMANILFPPTIPNTANYDDLKNMEGENITYLREQILKNAGNASLNSVIDQFVPANDEGLPSRVEAKANAARSFYLDVDSVASRIGDGSVQSIHEVTRNRAVMMAYSLRDKLDQFQRELEQEAALARKLSGELHSPIQ